jgi:hypothetical protein
VGLDGTVFPKSCPVQWGFLLSRNPSIDGKLMRPSTNSPPSALQAAPRPAPLQPKANAVMLYLCLCVRRPACLAFLQGAFAGLPAPMAAALLKALQRLLSLATGKTSAPAALLSVVPLEEAVVDWIATLVETNTVQLVSPCLGMSGPRGEEGKGGVPCVVLLSPFVVDAMHTHAYTPHTARCNR